MLIEINEAINGWTLQVFDRENPRTLEIFEKKTDVLWALYNYATNLYEHELTNFFEQERRS